MKRSNVLVCFCVGKEINDEFLGRYLPLIRRMNAGIGIVTGREGEKKNRQILKEFEKEMAYPTYLWGAEYMAGALDLIGLSTIPESLSSRLLGTKYPQFDYGLMRLKAVLMAIVSGARMLQFFDADVYPVPGSDIIRAHRWLVENSFSLVSGLYRGPKQVTASMFQSAEGRTAFLRLVERATGFSILCPSVVRGAMALGDDFFKAVPFPLLPATTMSDDALMGFFARMGGFRVFQSGEEVDHRHGSLFDMESREGEEWTREYIIRLMRIVALMAFLRKKWVKQIYREALLNQDTSWIFSQNQIEPAMNSLSQEVIAFLTELKEIAEKENNDMVARAASQAAEKRIWVLRDAIKGAEDYLLLLHFWPTFVKWAENEREKDWIKP